MLRLLHTRDDYDLAVQAARSTSSMNISVMAVNGFNVCFGLYYVYLECMIE